MPPDDIPAKAAQVSALSAYTGREVGDIEGEMLSCDKVVHHQYVTGPEIILFILCQGYRHLSVGKGERYRLAVKVFELVCAIQQSHIHATSVRSVIMDYLEIGPGQFRL